MLSVAIAATRRLDEAGAPMSSGTGLARLCCALCGEGGLASWSADETGACDVASMGQFGMTPVEELAAMAGAPCTVSIGCAGDIGDAPWTGGGKGAPWTGGVAGETLGKESPAARSRSAVLAARGVEAIPPRVRPVLC